jgi:hypothetical protein
VIFIPSASTDVANFFDPSVSCIIKAVQEQKAKSQKTISVHQSFHLQMPSADNTTQSVFLVGGFAASDWLFAQLKTTLEPLGLNVCRPDSHVYAYVAFPVSELISYLVAIRLLPTERLHFTSIIMCLSGSLSLRMACSAALIMTPASKNIVFDHPPNTSRYRDSRCCQGGLM